MTILKDWKLISDPLHSSVEVAGSAIALFVAYFLIRIQEKGKQDTQNYIFSSALIFMGILDGFHALVHAGQPFVWLHSTATFFGGLAFSLVWFQNKNQLRELFLKLPKYVFIFALIFSVLSLLLPKLIPPMVVDGKFTFLALLLNVAGGVFFLMAALKLYIKYKKEKEADHLIFFLHCILFGGAAIMFEQSQLWDAAWWGWHLLRFMAYIVALYYAAENLHTKQDGQKEDMLKQILHTSKMASIGELASGVAHEINNPVTVILGNTLVFKKKVNKEIPEKKIIIEYLDKQISAAHRISKIITSLRMYSSIDDENIELLDVHHIIENVRGITFDTYGLNFEVILSFKAEKFKVLGDTGRLQQAFVILLNNCRDACASVDNPRITIETKNIESQLTIEISDNGKGIPKELQEKVFDSFYTTKTTGEGTGLGLGILSKIINEMNGKILLKSEVGHGTTFSIHLPLSE